MNDNKIEQERFDAIKELSQIEMKLSDARVAFQKFKETEEEYLIQREKNVSIKLDEFVKSLEEGFQAFSQNKEIFEKIKTIVGDFSNKALSLAEETKSYSLYLMERIDTVDNFLSKKMEKLRDTSDKISSDRKDLDKELEDFYFRLRQLEEGERALNKRRKDFDEKWSLKE